MRRASMLATGKGLFVEVRAGRMTAGRPEDRPADGIRAARQILVNHVDGFLGDGVEGGNGLGVGFESRAGQ